MTDKEKLTALRAEIERRISSINNREHKIPADKVAVIQLEAVLSLYDSLQEEPKTDWLQELKERLDSLSKEDFKKVMAKYSKYGEKEPVSDDLEKEIDNYINSHFAEGCDGGMISDKHKDLGGVRYKDLIDLAEHFANWQKQKDEKILAKNNDEYTEGVRGKYITVTK